MGPIRLPSRVTVEMGGCDRVVLLCGVQFEGQCWVCAKDIAITVLKWSERTMQKEWSSAGRLANWPESEKLLLRDRKALEILSRHSPAWIGGVPRCLTVVPVESVAKLVLLLSGSVVEASVRPTVSVLEEIPDRVSRPPVDQGPEPLIFTQGPRKPRASPTWSARVESDLKFLKKWCLDEVVWERK